MKIVITDLIVRKREVEIPEVCPNCGVNFSIADSAVSRIDLRPWSFEGRCQNGVFTPADLEHRESEDEVPIEGLEYFCNACNHSLEKGHFSDKSSRAQPPGGGDEEDEGH